MKTVSGRKSKVRVTISENAFTLGWWMVMSEDEQGYAPASYLEPVEGNSSERDVHMEEITDQGKQMGGWQFMVLGGFLRKYIRSLHFLSLVISWNLSPQFAVILQY